jgi:hypothetical protein
MQTALGPDTAHEGVATVTFAVPLLEQPPLLVTVTLSVMLPALPAEKVMLGVAAPLVIVPLPLIVQT